MVMELLGTLLRQIGEAAEPVNLVLTTSWLCRVRRVAFGISKFCPSSLCTNQFIRALQLFPLSVQRNVCIIVSVGHAGYEIVSLD